MSEPEAPCPGPRPDATAGWDAEWAEYVAWLDREAAVGREPEPETCDPDGEEPWIPEDADLADPGRVGPVPLGPVPAAPERPLFAQDGAADVMPPSPFLAALTEQAVAEVTTLTNR